MPCHSTPCPPSIGARRRSAGAARRACDAKPGATRATTHSTGAQPLGATEDATETQPPDATGDATAHSAETQPLGAGKSTTESAARGGERTRRKRKRKGTRNGSTREKAQGEMQEKSQGEAQRLGAGTMRFGCPFPSVVNLWPESPVRFFRKARSCKFLANGLRTLTGNAPTRACIAKAVKLGSEAD